MRTIRVCDNEVAIMTVAEMKQRTLVRFTASSEEEAWRLFGPGTGRCQWL